MLTEIKIKALKPSNRYYKAYDAGGLFLEVMPSGSKLWRFRYQFAGRAKLLSLGDYPTTQDQRGPGTCATMPANDRGMVPIQGPSARPSGRGQQRTAITASNPWPWSGSTKRPRDG